MLARYIYPCIINGVINKQYLKKNFFILYKAPVMLSIRHSLYNIHRHNNLIIHNNKQ